PLDWLSGPIERAIERELPGLKVAIRSVILQHGEWGGAEFRLVDVKIRQANGFTVAEAPLAAIGLSGRGLFKGIVAPSSVEFISPKLQLSHSDAGGLSLRFQTANADPRKSAVTPAKVKKAHDLTPSLPERIDIISAVADQIAAAREGRQTTSFLTTFGVRDAEIEIERKGRTTIWQVPSFVVDLAYLQKRSVISGEGTLITGDRPWSLTFRSVESAKAKTLALAAEINGLMPKALTQTLPDLGMVTGIEAPISGRITVEMSTDGFLRSANADLTFGAGRIALPFLGDSPIPIDQGALVFAFDPAARKFDVQRFAVESGKNRLYATGQLKSETEKGVSPAVWHYQSNILEAVIEDLNLGPQGLPIDEWSVSGRLKPETSEISVDEMGLKIAGVDLDLKGEASRIANRPAFVLDGRIGPLQGSVARRLISRLKPDLTLEVLDRILPRGEITGGNLRLALLAPRAAPDTEPNAAEISIAFDMANVDLAPIAGLPPVRFASATARYAAKRLEIIAADGTISLASGRQVVIKDAEFSIPDLSADQPVLEAAFQVNGAASAVLELIDQEPLRHAQNAGLDPASVEGRADAHFRLSLPLKADVKLAEMRIEGKAKLAEA
ncbi:MAG: hypothetical protein F9K44_16405, partial [Hyphomicrobiaceae bacterium]